MIRAPEREANCGKKRLKVSSLRRDVFARYDSRAETGTSMDGKIR